MPFVNTEERYYKGNTLNKWFAIASVLFFGSIVLTFWDDNNDDFKNYQKEFRKIEAKIAEEKHSTALAGISEQVEDYEAKIEEAKTELDQKKSDLEKANKRLEKYEGKYYQANMDYLAHKGEIDALKYRLENNRSHAGHSDGHGDEHHENPFQEQYDTAIEKLNELRVAREIIENEVKLSEKHIDDLSLGFITANKNLESLMADVNLLRTNLEKLSFEHMSTANKVADVIRDLPIIDFLDPYYKVKQVVVDEIKYNVNFAQVQTVDRCMSCHLGIDKKGFEDQPQPYTTHPDLELYLTSASAHPIERFGCTGCHAGRARGTTFNTAVHMPNTSESQIEWENEFGWKQMHHWLKPMLPTRYSEAGCFKCHSNEAIIKGADKLTLGLSLIEKAGCYGCHTIEKYKDRRKSAPDLTRINEKTTQDWTRKWVKDPKSFRHNTWMPSFFNQENNSDHDSQLRNETEIYSIVNYLFKEKQEVDLEKSYSNYLGDIEEGKKIFESVGCMGCHTVNEDPDIEEETSLTSLLKKQGPNLIGLGSKTTPEWIYKWIKNPKEYWPETKMPDLRLSDKEAKNITAYLYSFSNSEFEEIQDLKLDSDELNNITQRWLNKKYSLDVAEAKYSKMNDVDKLDFVAKKSIAYYGCFGCHIIEGFEDAKPIGTELTYEGTKPVEKLDFGYIHDIDHTNYAWFEQKLENPRIFDRHKEVSPEDKLKMPNFEFNQLEIEALVTAILSFNEDVVDHSILGDASPEAILVNEGMNLIKEYNCQGCHIIEDFGGQIADIIGKPEYSPPNLNTQGAKTQPKWLYDFLKKPFILRPNLKVRMPSFNLIDEQWNAIIAAFRAMDGEVNTFENVHNVNKKSTTYHAGDKLAELGACENCHFMGKKFPKQDASTWAPNLAMTKSRLRPEWVVDWLRDPAKIMPGTKMPAPFIPTEDLLSIEGAVNDWGRAVIELSGDQEAMINGIRDWIFAIDGKEDLSKEIKNYFDKNGYLHLEASEDEEEDDDDWGDDEDW